ncbi:MAG: hypothetical protein LUE64_06605 [Candidatus Gastranaerophilales bacterium]|nr:hypothetical protein [Candidatus Gastranaerophilales bacterium]
MQIVVTGKNYQARKITELLSKNKDDFVFTDYDCAFQMREYAEEFIRANNISLVVDTRYGGLSPEIPSFLKYISSAKKFAYRNKIPTNKFWIFEKQQQAQDFILETEFPIVIMPDIPNAMQPPFIAETKQKAEKQIEKLFQTDNKKIIIENYISGVEYTKYIAFDGNHILNLIDTVGYFDEISTNNTGCVSSFVKTQIENEIMPLLLDAFMEEENGFKGIFGARFLVDKSRIPYFTKFRTFFGELDVDIALNTIDTDIKKLFLSCANGNLIADFDKIEKNAKYAICAEAEGKITSVFANTMSKVIDLAEFEGINTDLITEAIKHWHG